MVAGLLLMTAACGGGSADSSDEGDLDPSEWIAAQMEAAPDGYVVSLVDQSSSGGRRLAYGEASEGVGDNWRIMVTTRTSFDGYTIPEMLELSKNNGIDAAAEVNGHQAAVGPMTDEGRIYGYQVVWEQAPGVVISLEDSRYDGSTPIASEESALELAVRVRGMNRRAWDDALRAHEAASPYAGPPEGAVESEVADGVLDGRQWTLSILEEPVASSAFQDCFRLGYAGENTGPGCSLQRIVLADKGFVIGWTARSDETPELLPGRGSAFDPIRPVMHSLGTDAGWYVWIAVLPDGACGVELEGAPGSLGDSTLSLDLLPGDPGAVECATG